MTVRALPRSRLDALVPSLVAEQALVALVPATGDWKWAAAAAWDVARAATAGDRRVALVDLWLEAPRLHEMVHLAPTEGIVDAFEYDVSLTKAAHEIDHVFFIPAGTATAHASDLFTSPRWRRLHGGFRVEGALLLLYLSAGALARLSAVPDALIVLSPDGYEPESSIGQGITAAMERGIPLLGVVRERWTPGAVRAPPPGAVRVSAAATPRRRVRPVVVVLALAAGAAGGWVLWARGAEHLPGALGAPPLRPAAAPTLTPTPPTPTPTHSRTPSPRPTAHIAPSPRRDSLPWTIQFAAYARLDKALALGDRLAAGGLTPFVTPVANDDRRPTVWYRVLAGAYPTRDSALAARARVWRRGLAARGQGAALRAPYAFVISGASPPDSLRARGFPAVPWGGTGQLLVGAFESPEQATLTEARLKRAGIAATLVTRMGTAP
ncbi:MAG TPA: SPOR domain-containing protein [Gemmatimonadales bacterium]|nr:SPOR domain-containing protein [Gemmatimonadales bacterium]